MACIINLRDDLLTSSAQSGGTWTYNGAILITGSANPYDGNPDNVTQFTTSADTISNPPEELATINTSGDNPSLDSTGHTKAYYSLTYTLTSGSCTSANNVVLPIIEGPCFPYSSGPTINLCTSQTRLVLDLYSILSTVPSSTASSYTCKPIPTNGTWTQVQGTPNPHPGFVIDSTDPSQATFDTDAITYPSDNMPLVFRYTIPEASLTGFTTYDCDECKEMYRDITINVSNSYGCCTTLEQKYYFSIPNDGTVTVYDVVFADGSKLSTSSYAYYWTSSGYTAGNMWKLNSDILSHLANGTSGKGYIAQGNTTTGADPYIIEILGACQAPTVLWTAVDGSTTISPTISTIY